MDAVNDPTVEEVVVMKSAQVGWTEILNNIVAYFVDQDPSPVLILQPTLEMGEAWSKDRLAPMIRDTGCLSAKIKDPRARDSGNTLLHKTFPGGHLTIAGANSPASLASRPIRAVLADEVDRYPPSAGSEGDPLSLAYKRTTTFWNRKRLAGSTPTIAGASRIEKGWAQSDQRRFYVPCPHCGEAQVLRWQNVKWEEGRPDTAAYQCDHCGALWDDAERWAAVRKGEWRATEPFNGIAGFHVWEAYSPWVRLSDTVKAFLSAKEDPERLKTWVNTALGETWRDRGEAPDFERLFERREDFDGVPERVVFLTGFADVQKDRIEAFVWGWGRNAESWLIDREILWGDPSAVLAEGGQLDQFLVRTWKHAKGADLSLTRFGIDAGYATQEVYAWVRRQRPGLVLATKGQDHLQTAIGTPSAVDVNIAGKRHRRGVKIWPIGVSLLKSEFYGWLRQPLPEDGQPYPRGFVHLPKWADKEVCQQLVAEQLVTLRNGRREWQKLRERNEALDCRVGARAVAIATGMDRWSDAQWQELGAGVNAKPNAPPSRAERVRQEREPPRQEASRRSDGWLGGRQRGWLR